MKTIGKTTENEVIITMTRKEILDLMMIIFTAWNQDEKKGEKQFAKADYEYWQKFNNIQKNKQLW